MVLLNLATLKGAAAMQNILTFHYGAIEPMLLKLMKYANLKLTFHYGAIEPNEIAESIIKKG